MRDNILGAIRMRKMVDRRKSDQYRQVTAYVDKDLYLKFKSVLALRDLVQNEVVETLMKKWLEDYEK